VNNILIERTAPETVAIGECVAWTSVSISLVNRSQKLMNMYVMIGLIREIKSPRKQKAKFGY
jgi:hypothetical protein